MTDEMTTYGASETFLAPDTGGADSAAAPASSATCKTGGMWHRVSAQANLLLVILFVMGIAGIYLLSLRQQPEAASAEQKLTEREVDTVLSYLATSSGTATTAVKAKETVNAFYYQARQRQIPVDKLKMNPFVFEALAPAVAPPPPPPVKPKPQVVDEAAKEADDAMARARSLVLQSVLRGGDGAVAMISNNVLTEGQTILGWTVAKIEPRSVTLTWKDRTCVLEMPR